MPNHITGAEWLKYFAENQGDDETKIIAELSQADCKRIMEAIFTFAHRVGRECSDLTAKRMIERQNTSCKS